MWPFDSPLTLPSDDLFYRKAARLPYISSGVFFCDYADFLARWDELTLGVGRHPLFEQNMLAHGEALVRHGICNRAANPIEGFQLVT